MTRVLIVEDDPQLLRALAINLRARHYDVDTAPDGATALAAANRRPPDLVILDLGLPDMDGIQVIRGLRGWCPATIIVLSARETQTDKVSALDSGADDYMTKPFGMDELLARIRAAMRRVVPNTTAQPVVRTDTFTVDLSDRRVTTEDGEIRLTPTEWHVLEVLIRHSGKLVGQSSSSRRSGGPATSPRRTTCACTWLNSDASSNATQLAPDTC
jgi:two-component system, OmpR family, KDP operon response regulator KdpE